MQEKLTLFWHDHFAISGEKVFEGPTMLGYLNALRTHSGGRFVDLLKAVSKQAGLIGYLDANTSTKLHPNENFAREMFELFTLGEGNYTEKDVKEAARAFTGWSIHYGGIGDETPFEKQAEKAARAGMAVFNFCEVPAIHDDGEKNILGKTGRLTGDDVLDMLAASPKTARFVCKKLWEFFVYESPEPSVLDALVRRWKETDGTIALVCKTMATLPEFWSVKAVMSMPKSPLDFTVGMFRSLGLQDILQTFALTSKEAYEPVKEELRKAGSAVFYLMSQQGMTLLFPPNVGGWEWGKSWITANNTVLRVNHSQMIFWGDDQSRPIAMLVAAKLKASGKANSVEGLVDEIASIFDATLSEADRAVLVEACQAAGGPKSLDEKDQAAHLLASVTRLMFATPTFQLT
jgi:uncharacterized protein (DUF1800 family)